MTEPTTIRQDLKDIRDTARDGEDIENVAELHFLLACIREGAVAALDLLDNSKIIADVEGIKRIVLEPDPAPRGDEEPCAACGKPATGLAYFNDERFCHGDEPGASCYEKQQWAYSYWPQEKPPPYAADDEDKE